MKLTICPVTLQDARKWVDKYHRHHRAPQGGVFAIGVAVDKEVVGVAIVGRPVARGLHDGWTAEVTRVAVIEGHKNANSMLYSACWRAVRAMGYRKIVTYTLKSEPGTSLKAAGWEVIAQVRAKSWHTPSRPRMDKHSIDKRLRWEFSL